MRTKSLPTIPQAVEALSAAQQALSAAVADRDRLIAALVATPNGMKLREIGELFDLSIPRVCVIAKKHGAVRGPAVYPTGCSIRGCTRPHHSNGLCDAHRQQAERAERTKRKRYGPAPS